MSLATPSRVIPLRPVGAAPRAPRPVLKGRQPDAAARAAVRDALTPLAAGGLRRDALIEYLHALNDREGALREGHLVALAAELGVPVVEVFEVASFYHHFEVVRDDATVPRLTVRVCDGLSCAMAGAADLLSRLPALLDADVRVVAAPCIGRCETAPAALVGQRPVVHARPETVAAAARGDTGPPPAHPDLVDFDAYRAAGGYALVRELADGVRDPAAVLAAMESSALRGLGGAGFPAGRKWRIVSGQPGPRLMVVNIDEGEPGTFKDRHVLERDPHRMLEGMLVAARVVGIDAIYLYLRDEYPDVRRTLSEALDALRAAPPAPLPRIELRRGAGAYICGEESALIESVEGRRGEPRLRPPYIAERGLFGRPTLAHNAETLVWVRDIVTRGDEAFAAHGRHGRRGLRRFSVSGRVREPGVKLAPAGITLRELIDEHCGGMADGHTLYAYLPGGASGGILPARLADLPLDFDTLQPHGCFIGSAAIVVLSQHDRARDAALNTLRFFAHESCGQCTPCRVGTAKAAALMAQPVWDADTLRDLGAVMADASICGLGQAAPNPILGVLTHFAHEVGAGGDQP